MRIPISFDYSKSYGENLADAINKYWKMQVAEGYGTKHDGNVRMSSTNGVPKAALTTRAYVHDVILRVRSSGGRRWLIVGRW